MGNETKKIANNSLNDVSGGNNSVLADANKGPTSVNLLISSKSDEPQKKGNFLDKDGVYHITCLSCGKELNSFKPASDAAYAVGPQICDECSNKKSKIEEK